jgi:demethylmenaquinone methyltransferase/2-methoxy-6-polyprenyl-1,4-benzoquinol methylase
MEPSLVPFSRVNRSVHEAEGYYSRLSYIYDWLAASEKKYLRQGIKILNPQQGEKILEIGFGTGYAQLFIGQAVEGGFSAGLDISSGMAKIAHQRLAKAGLAGRIGLLRSDTLPIPFPDEIFDGVFSSFTLELFDSPLIPEVLSECGRVLKPGGRLVAVSLSKDRPLPWMGRLYEHLHDKYPRLLDCRPIPIQSLLSGSKFEVQSVRESSMWGLPVSIVLAYRQ